MQGVKGPNGITAVQQMVSSCTGAIVTSLMMTPLDVIKVRLQVQQKPMKPGSCFLFSNGLMDCLCVCSSCGPSGAPKGATGLSPGASGITGLPHKAHGPVNGTLWYERPSHFKGMTDAFVQISRNEGVTALWSGLPPTLLMSVPVTVIYFTAYDRLKYTLGYRENDPSTKYMPIAAGVIARTMASSVVSPVELLRVKMQSQQLTYRQLGAAVRASVGAQGPLYLWTGLGASLLRDVPFSGLYWFGYEFIKAQIMKRQDNSAPSFVQTFICGASSGTVAAVLTLPFDVIKTHKQIMLGEAVVTAGSASVMPTHKLIAQLYAQSGVSALFAGLMPRILKVAPACAIMISTYELGKRHFRSQNESLASDS